MALPLPLRNRLAELILASLHDRDSREALEALAAVDRNPRALDHRPLPPCFPADLFEPDGSGLVLAPALAPHRSEIFDRIRRGREAVRGRPFHPARPPLDVALVAAGWLFEAGLYFEVHEHLEPHWNEAGGEDRDTLQGVIQVAVGFQHLANGNLAGASALLHDGCARTIGRHLAGRDLGAFAGGVKRCLEDVIALGPAAATRFDWSRVPRFPAGAGPAGGAR